jgi:YesN/AraC family two-component response regulator
MESISCPVTSISILVVEDEVITLEYLVTILSKKFPGVALYKALNGRTGLELFKEHNPNIVITDINMPEMGGVQMAVNIHAMKPHTRFIVLTGNSKKQALQASTDKGFEFDHYIVKPVIFQELFTAVEKCIGEVEQNRP